MGKSTEQPIGNFIRKELLMKITFSLHVQIRYYILQNLVGIQKFDKTSNTI